MSSSCIPCGQSAANMQAPPRQQVQPAQQAPAQSVIAPNNVTTVANPRMGRPRHFFNGTK
jgi:hypothetical protein